MIIIIIIPRELAREENNDTTERDSSACTIHKDQISVRIKNSAWKKELQSTTM